VIKNEENQVKDKIPKLNFEILNNKDLLNLKKNDNLNNEHKEGNFCYY